MFLNSHQGWTFYLSVFLFLFLKEIKLIVSLNLSQARNDIATPPPPFSSTFTPRCVARFAINCGTSHPGGTWNLIVIYITIHTPMSNIIRNEVLIANETKTKKNNHM